MRSIYLLAFLFLNGILHAQTVSTFYPFSNIDDGLAIDSEGNLYGSRYTGSSVWKISPDGQRSNFVSGLDTPNGLAFDSNGYLFVIDNQGGAIYKVASDGTVSPHVPNIYSPSGIVKMPNSDTMVVSLWEGDKLVKIAPDGTINDFVIGTGLKGPVGMAYDENENLFVGNYNDRWIFRISPSGELDTLTRLAVLGDNIGFIAYRNEFIYATIPWDHKIYKVDMEGNYELYAGTSKGNNDGDISEAQFNGPNGIILSSGGDSLYISDFHSRSVRIISNLDGSTGVNEFLHLSSIEESKLLPNLVQDQTILNFTLSNSQQVSVLLYDIDGTIIKTIIQNQNLSTGEHRIPIDASELPTATYFVQIKTKEGSEVVKKMVKIN